MASEASDSPMASRRRSSTALASSKKKHRRRSMLDSSDKATSAAKAERRKSRLGGRDLGNDLARETVNSTEQSSNLLTTDQVSALYQQCIKLATENKITAKNTWALGLIDHLHDLVKPNDQEGSSTNFQRASITLGAGIEIYSKRVDSVHTAAYKVLSGLSKGRGLGDDEEDNDGEQEENDGDGSEPAKENSKAARRAAILRDVNPSSTLESSFEALNVKKFDLAFAVDPLFQRTSAQFDEGGARGLLLTNLSVYNGCEILFDSQEVPNRSREPPATTSAQIDLEPLRECFEAVERAAAGGAQICPAMDELYSLMGQPPESHYAEEIAQLAGSLPGPGTGDAGSSMGDDPREDPEHDLTDEDEAFQDALGGDDFDDSNIIEDGEEGVPPEPPAGVDGSQSFADMSITDDLPEHSAPSPEEEQETADETGNAVQWLISGVENLSLEGKAWAGASHWRYRARGKENEPTEVPAEKPKRAKKEKAGPLDFRNLPSLPENALKQANLKDITLKNWPAKANTLLPDDIHYKVSQLSELFLIPGIPFYELAIYRHHYRARGTQASGESEEESEGYGGEDYGGDFGGDGDDEQEGMDGWGDVNFEGAHDLISAPRKVAQIGINYARASKQVDVKALKHTLWQCIGEEHDRQQRSSSQASGLSFNHILSKLSPENVVGNVQDLSVHLCFICLLHLANENGLRITGSESLDQMLIWDVPSASLV